MTFNVNDAIFKLRTLKRKDQYVYYNGHLSRDRVQVIDGVLVMSKDEVFVCDEAMRRSNNGDVHLVQRTNKKRYDYIAIGR